MDETLEAKKRQHIRAFIQGIVRKPIHRYPNGKAIGRGSFWHRQPFDYADRERDLPKTHADHIRTQDLMFTDRTMRCTKDDVSISSRDPDRECEYDWEVHTGVKMTTRDITFSNLSHNKMLELAEANPTSGKGKLGDTPFERQYLEMTLEAKKQKVLKVLKKNKEGLIEAKKRARYHSRSKSSDPPVKNRKEKNRDSCT